MKTMTYTKYTETELAGALEEFVAKGYLQKCAQGWKDSDRVSSLLKEGKTRKQIMRLLEKEYKQQIKANNNKE